MEKAALLPALVHNAIDGIITMDDSVIIESIVAWYITPMKGTVSYSNTIKEGTLFTLTFPII